MTARPSPRSPSRRGGGGGSLMRSPFPEPTDGRTRSLRRRGRRRRCRIRAGRRDRGPHRRRDRRRGHRPLAVRDPHRAQCRRPAACRPRRHGLDRRRADPAHLRPRAARRPGDLGNQDRGSGVDQQRHRRRRQGRRLDRHHQHARRTAISSIWRLGSAPGRSAASRASGPTASRSISTGSPIASTPAARARRRIR